MRCLVVNGPNLNLLGTREPDVYGSTTLEDLHAMVDEWAGAMGVEVQCEQTNSEHGIIDLIQGYDGDAIVINPGAFTHTSRAIADAIRAVATPTVEVHISNIREREPWRAVSVISDACVRTIYGRGLVGYRDAMRHLVNRHSVPFETARYGPHQDNVADLRRGGGMDLVVLVHGGIWRQEHERDTTESLAVDLAIRGYDTLNVEYRRLGNGGGWPASGHDLLTFLDFVPQLDLRSRRVLVVSHSAGSFLSAWAATRSATPVALHLAMGPVLDLAASVDADDPCARGSALMLASGAPSVVAPGSIVTALLHGDADQIVPVAHSAAYAHHHGIEFHRTGCDHFSVLDPTKPEWEWARSRLGALR